MVRDDAERAAFDSRKGSDHSLAESAPELQHRPDVGDRIDDRPNVVHTQPVFWDRGAERTLVGSLPVRENALKIAEILLRDRHGLCVILHQYVDHSISVLGVGWPDIFGRKDTESSAFDHSGAAHADVRGFGGNDDVATAEERRVAGEAAPRPHADQGNLAGEFREVLKSAAIEPCDERVIGVPWTPAASFREQHDGELLLLCDLEHPVLLQVVHGPLGSGKDRVVV